MVSLNERKYPINYLEYENTDVYEDSMLINIEEGHTFVEIPESKELLNPINIQSLENM